MKDTISSKSVIYRKFGDPRQVIEVAKIDVSTDLEDGQVLVQWIASPINPLDINKVQGVYAVKQDLPAVGGSEGVGEVVKVTKQSKLRLGDRVCWTGQSSNCWSEYGVVYEDELLKLHRDIPIEVAATFLINPPTAWVMLKKYGNLSPGDYIIQNAANSGVGRNVIQLCKAWGIRSINLIRDRPNVESLKTDLWRIGADHVFTEDEFQRSNKEIMKKIGTKPKLALNGVGGKSSLLITSVLQYGSTCVVYGGMSKKAHEFSTSAILFNNVKVEGIMIYLWMQTPEYADEVKQCFEELQTLALRKQITGPPMDHNSIDDIKIAIGKHMKGGERKQLIIIKRTASNI